MSDQKQVKLDLTAIRPSRWQARQTFSVERLWELAISISEHGLINAPLVMAVGPDGGPYVSNEAPPVYELIAGERRLRAMAAVQWADLSSDVHLTAAVEVLANTTFLWEEVPPECIRLIGNGAVTVTCSLRAGIPLDTAHRLAVVENLEREQLTPIEEARAVLQLQQELGLSTRDLAQQISRSQSWVQQRLAILGTDQDVQQAVTDGELTVSHAREIATVKRELQPLVARAAAGDADQQDDVGISVRETADLVKHLNRFMDPDTWDPEEQHKALDQKLINRLTALQYAAQHVDLTAQGAKILALAQVHTYRAESLLHLDAYTIADQWHEKALEAMGLTDLHEYAVSTDRICATCLLQSTHLDYSNRTYMAICPRWWCESMEVQEKGVGWSKWLPCYVGVDDQVGIEVHEDIARYASEIDDDLVLERGNRHLVLDVTTALAAARLYLDPVVDGAVDPHAEAKKRRRLVAYELRKWSEFLVWYHRTGIDDQEISGFAADCRTCSHRTEWPFGESPHQLPAWCSHLRPLMLQGTDRLPYSSFMIRSTPTGRVYPICRNYKASELSWPHRLDGCEISPHTLLEWIQFTLHTTERRIGGSALYFLPLASKNAETEKWIEALDEHQDELGGPAGLGALFNWLVGEAQATRSASQGFTEYHAKFQSPLTLETQELAVLPWQEVKDGKVAFASWRKWPEELTFPVVPLPADETGETNEDGDPVLIDQFELTADWILDKTFGEESRDG